MKLQNDVIIVSTPLLDTPTRWDNTQEPHKGFLMQNSPTEFLNFNNTPWTAKPQARSILTPSTPKWLKQIKVVLHCLAIPYHILEPSTSTFVIVFSFDRLWAPTLHQVQKLCSFRSSIAWLPYMDQQSKDGTVDTHSMRSCYRLVIVAGHGHCCPPSFSSPVIQVFLHLTWGFAVQGVLLKFIEIWQWDNADVFLTLLRARVGDLWYSFTHLWDVLIFSFISSVLL
jgi:hypothetical protein